MRKSIWLLVALLLVGCNGSIIPTATPTPTAPSISLPDVFRGIRANSGWTTAQGTRIYNHDTLFDLMDGQSEFFFTYGFQQVAVQSYKNTEGARLDIQVWQLMTSADAYGLFTTGISGSSAAIGNDGDSEPGRRLSFWQDRYMVQVSARQPLDDSILWTLAREISKALPQGGERPGLVKRLPSAGLDERGSIFFHEELVLRDQIWIGDGNSLGLSRDTNGILARYNFGGQTARLLLIQYPSAAQAVAGRNILQTASVKDRVAVQARGELLGAVFGQVDLFQADKLLEAALE